MRGTGMRDFILVMIMLLLPLHSSGAEAVKLKYKLSIYADEKGNGLKQPEGIACREGRVVAADSGNGRLVLFMNDGGELKGGTEVKIPQIVYPVRAKIAPNGDILVLDERQRKIARLSQQGAFKQYVEPSGLPAQTLVVPAGIDVDGSGALYLLDIVAGRVLVLDKDGKYQRQADFPKEYGFITDLAVDSRGTIFITDGVTATVYSNAKDPAVFSPLSKALKEDIKFASNISVDNNGTLYISDRNGGGIAVLGQDGSLRSRQLSLGWKEGMVRYPSQTCIDKDGDLIIADRANNRIQVFSAVQ